MSFPTFSQKITLKCCQRNTQITSDTRENENNKFRNEKKVQTRLKSHSLTPTDTHVYIKGTLSEHLKLQKIQGKKRKVDKKIVSNKASSSHDDGDRVELYIILYYIYIIILYIYIYIDIYDR